MWSITNIHKNNGCINNFRKNNPNVKFLRFALFLLCQFFITYSCICSFYHCQRMKFLDWVLFCFCFSFFFGFFILLGFFWQLPGFYFILFFFFAVAWFFFLIVLRSTSSNSPIRNHNFFNHVAKAESTQTAQKFQVQWSQTLSYSCPKNESYRLWNVSESNYYSY